MDDSRRPVARLAPVLDAAWQTVTGHFWTLLAVTVLVRTPITVIMQFVPANQASELRDIIRAMQIQGLLDLLIGTLGALAIVHITVAAARGERLGPGGAFGRAASMYGSGVFVTFLYNVGTSLGTLLLVVPGILIAVYAFFCLQALVVNGRRGLDALNYSYEVVKGRWWTMFARLVVLGLLSFAAIVVVMIPFEFLPPSLWVAVVGAVPVDLIGMFFTVCATELWLQTDQQSADDETVEVFA